MRKSIALMLGEANSKMSGHVALLNYRYLNLCVKAEAASLLPVTVQYDGNSYDIEQVADVASPREDQLQVYPKGPELVVPIGKAIAEAHPEFKQKVVEEKNNNSSPNNGEEENKSILLTMPEVDKNRHDALMEGVKVLYDETKQELTSIFEDYTQKTIIQLLGASAEEINEAKKALEDMKKQHFDLADGYRKNKEKEIEDAYKRYMEQKEEKDKSKQAHDAATNKKAGERLKMPTAAKVAMAIDTGMMVGEALRMPEAPKTPKMEVPKTPKMGTPKMEAPKAPKMEVPKMEMPKSPEMPK